ncbi:MAG: hypothetical protein IT353_00445 [Gemmatimonadaceae bacterium]|nr:hypothetical protein [Gemmatimonadaceae bacterium]
MVEPTQLLVLSPSSVLITGGRTGLVTVDLKTGTSREALRVGGGPGEFRSIGRVASCGSSVLLLDPALSRASWFSATTLAFERSMQMPTTVMSRGSIQDAWCSGDKVWFSIERPPNVSNGTPRDSLMVYGVAVSGASIDSIGPFAGTSRIERSRGQLRFSLRQAYTSPPQILPGEPITVVYRDRNIVERYAPRGRTSQKTATSIAPVALTASHIATLRDSIRAWYDDQLTLQSYPESMKKSFRDILAEVIDEITAPPSLPFVRSAVRVSDTPGLFMVLLNDIPNARQKCFGLLTALGKLTRGRCVDASVGGVKAFAATRDMYYVVQANDEEAWLRRIPR